MLPAESKADPGEMLIEVSVVAPWPVPVRLMVCGLFEPLSVIVTVPVWVPVAVGVKVTVIVHLAAAAKELPQLLV